MCALALLLVTLIFPGQNQAAPLHPVRASLVTTVPVRGDGGAWGIRFSWHTRDYVVEMKAGKRWIALSSGMYAPLGGVALPTAVNDGRPLRITATFRSPVPMSIEPFSGIAADRAYKLASTAMFLGFFLAMGIVNAISWMLLRNASSAWYMGLALSMALISAYSLGLLRWMSDAVPLIDSLTHSALIASYMLCVVGFGISLLRALSFDRILAYATIAVGLINAVLVFFEDIYAYSWAYYPVDQFMLDAMIVLLVVLGIRALLHGGAPFARSYLIAFIGPAAGLPLNDLAFHGIIHGEWLIFTFWYGVAWEATFFSYAVAVANRTLIRERDLLDTMAHSDALTGVANRRTFDEALARAWASYERHATHVSLVMIDIDRFKQLNDTLGHRHGDGVLQTVARVCAAITTRAGDCFARYGGEEFAAVLVGTEIEGAEIVAERMRAAVEAAGETTISLGVATTSLLTPDSETLVAQADAALYLAKESGRNQVCRAERLTA